MGFGAFTANWDIQLILNRVQTLRIFETIDSYTKYMKLFRKLCWKPQIEYIQPKLPVSTTLGASAWFCMKFGVNNQNTRTKSHSKTKSFHYSKHHSVIQARTEFKANVYLVYKPQWQSCNAGSEPATTFLSFCLQVFHYFLVKNKKKEKVR